MYPNKNFTNHEGPLVSIHIICYNQEKFIRDTLESVINQSYKNIEIVVADDGSTDSTPSIILEYKERYPEKIVPIVGLANLGITGNSNRGLDSCRGKYIAFLGGDDLMLPDKIEKQVRHMESNEDCDICYHNLEVFDHETGKVIGYFNDATTPRRADVRFIIKRGTINGGSSTMVRASSVGMTRFDKRLPVASDWCFWVDVLLHRNGKIDYIDEILGRYRRHDKNVSSFGGHRLSDAFYDHVDTCTKIMITRPEYAYQARYRLGEILRGMRHIGPYRNHLINSFSISFQWKTLLLLFLFLFSFGFVKR